MAPFQIPQTPTAKTRLDSDVQEIDSVSDDPSPRTRSPAIPALSALSAADRDASSHAAKYRPQKTASPHPRRLLELPLTDTLQRLSIGSLSDDARAALSFSSSPAAVDSPDAPPRKGGRFTRFWRRFWRHQAAVVYVFLSQLFGSLMNMSARLLELDSLHPMHPFQLLFARMTVTVVICSAYMYWKRIPHFPLGAPEVRWHLVCRGLFGFCGLTSMWFSMMYLPLAEATVITFLAPGVSGYICHVLLHDPFTRREQIASVIALLGVVLIARPLSLFSAFASGSDSALSVITNSTDMANSTAALQTGGERAEAVLAEHAAEAASAISSIVSKVLDVATASDVIGVNASISTGATGEGDEALPSPFGEADVTTEQRLLAIGVALIGVLGTAGAFTTIRAIGQRAHALISVNYFSATGTIVSTTVLILAPAIGFGQPTLRFGLPHSLLQWVLLAATCVCGFLTQIFITLGLGLERSNRASAMIYTNMLFAAGFDRFIFGHQMGAISLIGCGLIVGSALWSALAKAEPSASAALHRSDDIEFGPVGHLATREGESLPILAVNDSDSDSDGDSDDCNDRERQSPRIA